MSAEPYPGCISFQSLITSNPGLPKLPSVSSLKVDTNGVCCILFSSGTTGLPKSVMLTHRNLVVANAVLKYVLAMQVYSYTVNNIKKLHP